MRNKENMSRDMKHAKYHRIIKGDVEKLVRIKLMYEDLNPSLREFYSGYELLFHVDMETWNFMTKALGLKVDKTVRQKKVWRIA